MAVPKHPHLFTWGLSKNEIIYIYILVYRFKGITLVKPKIRVSIITSGCQGYIKNQVSGQTHQTLPGSLCHVCSIHFNPVQHDHFMPDLSQTGHSIHWDPGKVDTVDLARLDTVDPHLMLDQPGAVSCPKRFSCCSWAQSALDLGVILLRFLWISLDFYNSMDSWGEKMWKDVKRSGHHDQKNYCYK